MWSLVVIGRTTAQIAVSRVICQLAKNMKPELDAVGLPEAADIPEDGPSERSMCVAIFVCSQSFQRNTIVVSSRRCGLESLKAICWGRFAGL
jgi:hypothetical protein